jgi:hypothetical protein
MAFQSKVQVGCRVPSGNLKKFYFFYPKDLAQKGLMELALFSQQLRELPKWWQ